MAKQNQSFQSLAVTYATAWWTTCDMWVGLKKKCLQFRPDRYTVREKKAEQSHPKFQLALLRCLYFSLSKFGPRIAAPAICRFRCHIPCLFRFGGIVHMRWVNLISFALFFFLYRMYVGWLQSDHSQNVEDQLSEGNSIYQKTHSNVEGYVLLVC